MLVEVWQDTTCPWCRIAKRNLQLALEQWQGEPVEVGYRTFMLDPQLPPEGKAFAEAIRPRTGETAVEEWIDLVRQRGSAVGVEFDFERIKTMPNTLLSQRLLAIVPLEAQGALLDNIYTAFFEQGEDIGSLDVLIRLAEGRGLDGGLLRRQLANNGGSIKVMGDADLARELKIRGVPFFVFNRQFGLSGAQRPEMLVRAFENAIARAEG